MAVYRMYWLSRANKVDRTATIREAVVATNTWGKVRRLEKAVVA